MEWVRRAAEQGVRRAQLALAEAYAAGLYGLPKDAAQAQFWFERAGQPMH
jgi:TPR repeat protein